MTEPWNPATGITRRRFASLSGSALVSLLLGGACDASEMQPGADGRLTARPRKPVTKDGGSAPGSRPLGLAEGRDAIVQLPANANGTRLPLLVLLHGAGGSGAGILRRLGAAADEAGVAVIAPDSRDATWDAIRGNFGPDVVFLNRALDRVFETLSVDPGSVSVGGFSDGATYALSLGLLNGDLFRRVLAFSPGFIVGDRQRGTPRVFVSHGRGDPILPIDRCSRVIVPGLQQRGYDVTFREFEGGHTIPPDIAREGMHWVAGK